MTELCEQSSNRSCLRNEEHDLDYYARARILTNNPIKPLWGLELLRTRGASTPWEWPEVQLQQETQS